jgi:hypothetical protein
MGGSLGDSCGPALGEDVLNEQPLIGADGTSGIAFHGWTFLGQFGNSQLITSTDYF